MPRILDWVEHLSRVSDETYDRLSPWIQKLAIIPILLHSGFGLAKQLAGESEDPIFRVIAIAILVPYTVPLRLFPNSLSRLIKHCTLPVIALVAPTFMIHSFLLELCETNPDLATVIRRQYEVIGATVLIYAMTAEWKVTTATLTLFAAITFSYFSFFESPDYRILSETWSNLASSYLIFLFALVLFASRHHSRIIDNAKALSTLGLSVAHELRTPLLSIRARIEPLSAESSDLHEIYQNVVAEVDAANTMIDMVLIKASGGNNIESEIFSVGEAIEDAISRYPYRSVREKSGVSFRLHEDSYIFGPKLLLIHVLFNLLKNALTNVAPSRGVEVSVDCYRTGDSMIIEFKDYGRGIPKAIQASIFEPLFSQTENKFGTGIGLSFCRSTIEERFKGEISLQSSSAESTLFLVKLPCVMRRESGS